MDTLYLTDLDGTLLDGRGRLSPFSARALRRLYDAGVAVSVATGRALEGLHVLEGAPFRAPLVLLGGARVREAESGKILWERTLTRAQVRAALAVFRGAGLCPLLYTQDAADAQRVYFERGADENVHAYVAAMRAAGDGRFRRVERLEERLGEKAFYLTARGAEEQLSLLLPQLLKTGAYAYLYHGIRAEGCFLEVTPVSKREGVEELRRLTRAGRIVAFGDNGNDAGLFAAADLRVAVGNATPGIRALADRVIGENTRDAVVRCIAEMEGVRLEEEA